MRTSKRENILFAAALLAACSVQVHAQFDADVMAKWATVTRIGYQITGEYRGTPRLAKDETGALGDVSDKVVVEFIWDAGEATMAGDAKVTNFTSTVENLRNMEKTCLPPRLSGPYEHFTLVSVEGGLGGYLHMQSTRKFAAAEVDSDCLGKLHHVAEQEASATEQLMVPGAMLLGLPPGSGGPKIKPGPDKDSLIVTDGDWTWTYRLKPL